MKRTRLILAGAACWLVLAVPSAPPAAAQSARIEDIEVATGADTVSILVRLSGQPSAAVAKTSGADLIVDIDGVALDAFTLKPAGSLIRHVQAEEGKLVLSGAAFSSASTVIYRNAVLVEARFAEADIEGESMLARAASPSAGRTETPATVTAPAPATPSAAPVARKLSTELAGLDADACASAAATVVEDAWNVQALGDHALCAIDEGDAREASERLDQLAAFSPGDWRVALGRAVLDLRAGRTSDAEIGFRNAAQLAPDGDVRSRLKTHIEKSAATG